MLDAGVTKTYARASQETTSELLTQTLAISPVVGKKGATRNEIVTAARVPNDRTEPYEKEGFVWVGQLGLKFNTRGQFKKAVAGPQRRPTLPSSGPAYGGPLKSNVRPLKLPSLTLRK
jgi:hypothetical protein